MRTIVHVDGGCEPNPGDGGWGVVISDPDRFVELCGGEADTTNNRMELIAAIRALEHFPKGAQIEIRSDSQYVVKAMNEWMPGWKAKGWRTTTGLVKNLDLMQRLDELASRRDVKWTWVRGHTGNRLNERADRLAAQGRRQALKAQSAEVAAGSAQDSVLKQRLGAVPDGVAVRHSSNLSAQPAPVLRRAPVRLDLSGCTIPVRIPLALGHDIRCLANRSGITQAAFIDTALKLALALGPEEAACLLTKITLSTASSG